MENIVLIGNTIKSKRLDLNLTTEQLANMSGISRSTLFAIESGKGNYTISALSRVLEQLSLKLELNGFEPAINNKERASRINSKLDKRINRFIIMCIEQYCASVKKSSAEVYPSMVNKGVIKELTNDYEFLHGMSTIWLNDFIGAMLRN